MQTLYVPKYNLHYRVNPKDPRELQWSRKPFGPATQWQHAMSFRNPIRALDLDDETKQGVVVLNDSTTYVGSGVRTWGRKYYPAGTRIYSLYAIGESLDIKVGTGEEFICLYYGNTLVLPDGTIVDVTPTTRRPHKFGVMDFDKNGVIHGYDVVEPYNEYDIYCDDVSALQQWSDRNGWGVGIGRDAPSMAVAKEIETNKKLGLIHEERKMMSKIRIKVHEHHNEASATQTKEWKSLVKLVTKIVSQAEIDSKRCYEAFKTEHPNDGACWIILGNPPIMAMDVWSVQGIGSITWHTVPFTYKGDYGTYTDTDRQTTINALTSEVYYSSNAMGRTFFERYPNPTEDDVRYWFKVPRNIKAFIGYDGTNYVYSASVADAERASVRDTKTLRKATPEEIKDKSIAWSMEGEDKYGRRMVNYRLGIWRPLTETEFYGSGTVD